MICSALFLPVCLRLFLSYPTLIAPVVYMASEHLNIHYRKPTLGLFVLVDFRSEQMAQNRFEVVYYPHLNYSIISSFSSHFILLAYNNSSKAFSHFGVEFITRVQEA